MPSATRYSPDKLAAGLLTFGLLFSLLISFFTHNGLYTYHGKYLSHSAYVIIINIAILLLLAHYYCIGLGYRWAKILFFLFFGFNVLSALFGFNKVLHTQFATPEVVGCQWTRS